MGLTGEQSTGFGNDSLLDIENLTGSIFDDTLIGNDQNNVLDGDAGIDMLIGQGGDDDYIMNNEADVVVEAANQKRARIAYSARSPCISTTTWKT